MDKALYPFGQRGLDHVKRPRDIARFEPGRIGSIDHPGDVDHRLGPAYQFTQPRGIGQIARDPFHTVAQTLRPPGQRADGFAGLYRAIKQSLADKTGRAGNGQGHSTTIWSR